MKKMNIVAIVLALVVGLVYYYLILPPLNLSAVSFYVWIASMLGVYLFYIYSEAVYYKAKKDEFEASKSFKKMMMVGGIVGAMFVVIIINNFVLSPIFIADTYHQRIEVVDADFATSVSEVDFNNLPLIDKASTEKLGDRVLGQLPELISQFVVSNEYTQVNYNGQIVRVTPLEYEGLIRYINNRSEGVPGYIVVNSTTGVADLVQLEEGMRYMPSAYLQEDLMRHVRFGYPTEIFGEVSFEVDEEGNPYWIIQTLKYTGINMIEEVSGIIAVDPITGDMTKYNTSEVPSWIDNVWDAGLIMEQLNSWGMYVNGFFNSILGQRGVSRTTEGYNYLTLDGDVYVYTGITSVLADESNIGFTLVNLRTKEAHFYAVPGAEEFSAMESARGLVQEKNYSSTFPLLINLQGKPTYVLSLKDAAGLIKMYAFVDVEDYQKVSVTDSSLGILTAAEEYLGVEIEDDLTYEDTTEGSATITQLRYLNVDGTSYAYFKDENNTIYRVSLKVSDDVAFLQDTQTISFEYVINGDLREIVVLK